MPSTVATRRTAPVAMDGKLDEAAWAAAPPITQFTQFNPDEGQAPTQRTEVRILYDDDALYIGATMYDTDGPKGISTRLVRRDNDFDSDFFQIVIDGYHDHLSRAFFTVNPSGSKQDQIGIGASCCDSGWDPVWQVESRINADGWVTEIRIPFSQLRYAS
ncbi:MAG: carbohydrate binding family 9 domain-containing protein, partial [Gemmatimonadaceae bacterium]